MPELPEVETTLRGIEPFLAGHLIDSVCVRNGSLRWPVSEQVYQLQGARITGLTRRGKYIIVETDQGSLIIHLGMSGSLRVVDDNAAPRKHDHVDFVVAGGKVVRYHDPRRFGCILWSDHWQTHALISSMGVEPLSPLLTDDYLYGRSRKRKTPIKHFIMDGRIVVGVGNIYANEALFLSGINPRLAAGKVSRVRFATLVENIKRVLGKAIEQGGTTLRDFVNSDGQPGYFKQSLYVYGRAGQACKICNTPLREIRQSQRSTVFCPHCQK